MAENEQENDDRKSDEEPGDGDQEQADIDHEEGADSDDAEWKELRRMATEAGVTPGEFYEFARRGQNAALSEVEKRRREQEESMWDEYEEETRKTQSSPTEKIENEEDEESFLTRKQAAAVARTEAERLYEKRETAREKARRENAEHERILAAAGIKNPTIAKMTRAYAQELQENSGISLETAYRDAIRALEAEGAIVTPVKRIKSQVERTAAMKRHGETQRGGAAPAGRPPVEPEEPKEELASDELQRHMTPEEAARYIDASVAERQQLHDKLRARAAASLL